MADSPLILEYKNGLREVDGEVDPIYGSDENTVAEGDDSRFSADQTRKVKKNPGAGEFSSVKAAVDSITDATASKPYQVFVKAGVYVEDTITMKPFVNIRGSRNATILEINSPAKDLIVGTNNAEVSECTLRGSTNSGKALVRVSSTAAGDVFTIRDCLLGDADSFVTLDSSNLAQVTVIACMSLTTADTSIAFKLSGAGYNILNLVGFSGSIPTGRTVGKLLEMQGPNATAVVHCCGVMNAGGTLTTGIEVFNGATLNLQSTAILGAVTGLSFPNTGAGPVIRAANATLESVTNDINLAHPSATGFISGAWTHDKEVINALSSVSVHHSDPSPGTGLAVLGDIIQGADRTKSVNLTKLTREGATVGLLEGGALTNGSTAFKLDVAAGNGFLDDSDGVVQEISWEAETQTLVGIERVYIVVNENGLVQRVPSVSDLKNYILLGRVVTNSAGIVFIEDSSHSMLHWGNRAEEYLRKGLGALFTNGCIISENGATDRALDMTAGAYFFGTKEYKPSGGAPIPFVTVKRDGSGGYTSNPGQTVVDNTSYDNNNAGGTLEAITAGYFVKHTLLIVGDGAKQKQFLIYAQNEYATEGETIAAPLASEPPGTIDGLTRIASVIVQQGVSPAALVLDERPRLGFTSSSSQTASTHGSLFGLEQDDHTQYLLGDGTRAMSGNLQLGGNNITNVGTVNDVVVQTHASRHLPNGVDPLTTAIAAGLSGSTVNSIGIQNSLARSDHSHAIATGVVSSQTPDASNAEGTSANLARADHLHNIPAASPTASLSGDSTNQEGVALSFARSDHNHNIVTGVVSEVLPEQGNNEGSSANLARADHIHNIPTASATALGPDGGSSEGTANSFARADHLHNIPADAPTTNLSATTTNTEGSGSSFSRSDHVHAISTGTTTTQTPDQTNAEGTASTLARSDHTHNIPTETPQTVGTANAEGVANSFARSDHVHSHGNQAGGALHAVATQSINGFMSNTDKYILDQIMRIKTLRQEETGFPNFTDAEFSFSNVTKQFTIQPKAPATQFSYFINGIEHIKTGAESVAINESVSSGEGVHAFYYDNGTLVADHSPPDVSLFKDVAFISLIYWDSTNVKRIRFHEERHGIAMPGATHEYLHLIEGARFRFGLGFTAFSNGAGTLDADYQFACADGEVRDEDIPVIVTNGAPQTLGPILRAPIFYRTGAQSFFRRKDADNIPMIYSGSAGYSGPNGRVPWNRDTGAGHILQEAQEGYYVPIHFFASADIEEPVMGVQGQSEYADLAEARDGAVSEILTIKASLEGLGKEFVPLGSILIRTSSSYTNTAKALRANTPGGDSYVDVRGLQVSVSTGGGSSANNSHSSLADLNNDDHVQYLNRSGVRAMTGNLDMGAQSITNVNLVDGVDVSDHKNRHRPDGDDAIDTAAPVTNLTANTTNLIGTANSVSRSDHVHAINTATPSGLTPDLANSEGTSANLARADHVHNIPANVPSQQLADQVLAEGVATSFARADHIHNIPTGVPGTLNPDAGNQQGSSTSFAKSDHVHNVPADVAVQLTPDLTNAEGNSVSFSRANHIHNIPTAVPPTLTPDLGNQQGSASSFSKSDHVHDIPAQTPSQQLTDQTNSEGSALSFARSDHIHNIPTATPSGLTPDAGNSQGVSTSFAKADHIHDVPAAVAVTLGVANAEGVANSFARSDHVHDHGQQSQTDLHALVTRTGHGFQSSTDKVKLDQMATGVLQYTNGALITSSVEAYVVMPLSASKSSYPNSLLTKVNDNDFRTEFNGAVEISYKVLARVGRDDRTYSVAVFKNGGLLGHTVTQATGKNNATRLNTVSLVFEDDCSALDVYNLRIYDLTGNTVTVLADQALMRVKVSRIAL